MAEEKISRPDTAGARTEEVNQEPTQMAAEAGNAVTGEGPNAAGGSAPSTAEVHVPSTSNPEATDLPTQDNPDPTTANPEVNPNAATEKKSGASTSEKGLDQPEGQSKPAETQTVEASKTAQREGKKPAKLAAKDNASPEQDPEDKKPATAAKGEKKPKKEAKPAVEDKPFPEFIQQDYLPALEKAFTKRDIADLQLTFEQNKVTGRWADGQRQFTVYFPKQDLKGTKAFSCAPNGLKPSAIEPFLIDERAITTDLLVFGVVQRLNAEKWFGKN